VSMEDEAVPVDDDGAALPGDGELPPGGERGPRDDIAAAGPRPLDEAADGDAAEGDAADGDAADGGAADSDAADGDAGPAEGAAGPGLRASLEAILLVVDEPVPEIVIAQVLERPREEVAAALRDLAASYDAEQRGFDLREVAGGWRYYTRAECAPVVERFVRDGQEVRLTQAALETLAVVAYRQPVNRARVSAVRGVNCDSVLRTLTLRGLVEEAGTESETGAILYRTTGYFLERLGLASLTELPDLAPFLPEHVEDVEDAVDERQGT
jgi:segregation and condensation protein B